MEHAQGWNVEDASFGGPTIRYRTKGHGPALLALPRDNGWGPSVEFLDALAREWRVVAPWLPGFHDGGPPEEWAWLRDTREMALVLGAFVRELGLADVTAVGLGYGGWIAAEMAVARPETFRQLVLVSPMGIRPAQGAIYDQFLVGTEHYAQRAFHDAKQFQRVYGDEVPFEQLEAWETDREQVCRIAWKPYMYAASLERLLAAVTVPAVIVHGDDDRIVPRECSERYAAALPHARLVDLRECGHAADLEQPDELARIVNGVRSQAAGQEA